MSKQDIYELVTNTIIEAIESGQTGDKFQMPWHGGITIPNNANTGNSYNGVNVALLWAYQQKHSYKSDIWATYKQWADMGAQVKKGAKSVQIVFWKSFKEEPADDNEEEKTRMFARWSNVFNADQVEGYEIPIEGESISEIQAIGTADALIDATGADIRYGGTRACYNSKEDYIQIPSPELFKATKNSSATENFYSTIFHEITHYSGAKHRLNRMENLRGSGYAFEELIAELGAAMLCAKTGVTSSVRNDHAHYIDSWLTALKNDKRYIFKAASQAQKAVDYICSF